MLLFEFEVKNLFFLYQNFRNYPARILLDHSLVVEHRNLGILLRFSEFMKNYYFSSVVSKAFDFQKGFSITILTICH